jgi:transmembrane 9 superfamily protein 3
VQIIHVNLTSTEPVALKDGEAVAFTFAVNWLPTVTPFKSRFERYLDYNFFEHKVQQALRTMSSCNNGQDQLTQQ